MCKRIGKTDYRGKTNKLIYCNSEFQVFTIIRQHNHHDHHRQYSRICIVLRLLHRMKFCESVTQPSFNI